MQYKDYYQTLGVTKDASQDEIKRAYRKLARKFHPDVSKEPDAEARFKDINEAHEVLKDPEKRAAYDQLGKQWQGGQDFRPPPDWEAGFEFTGSGRSAGDARNFSDFFEELFGARSPFSQGGTGHTQQRPRGQDHHAKVMVSLEDSYNGAQRSLQLQMPEQDAQGRVSLRTRVLNVRIPKGVSAGQKIRLSGQGAPGMAGAATGDLYLEIEFEPHALFQVEGRDVHLVLPLTPAEAALGARVQVPTLGGLLDMKIPAGSQTGQKLRLKGRGLPGQPPGDQFTTLKIVNPPVIDSTLRELYERMAKESRFNPRADWERYSGAA